MLGSGINSLTICFMDLRVQLPGTLQGEVFALCRLLTSLRALCTKRVPNGLEVCGTDLKDLRARSVLFLCSNECAADLDPDPAVHIP